MDPEYVGLVATTWDILRGDMSDWPDRDFYERLIEKHGQPALDVGCGTGRLLLDYLAKGFDVDGVDISSEMLSICRSRAAAMGLHPNLFDQRMENLDLPRKYRTIMVPSSSFQLVIEPPAAKKAMHRFHDHVEPGGILVMPFIVFGRAAGNVGETSEKEVLREDGALVRRRAFDRYDPLTQLGHSDYVFEIVVGGKVVESERHVRSPATRGYTLEQAYALFDDAGFQIECVVAGFSERPFREGDDVFTIVASASHVG